MRYLIFNTFITFLIFIGCLVVSCKDKLKANEFNIYVSEKNPGWHFVDLKYDTLKKGYHKIDVKFAMGQKFQTAVLRHDLNDYSPTFLKDNKDTIRGELWFVGEYSYDSLQKTFICFYMPNETQRKNIKNYFKDPSYDSLRKDMNIVVETYLRKKNELK